MEGLSKNEKKSERTHKHGQQWGDCGGGAWVEVKEGTRGVNGDGKYTLNEKKYHSHLRSRPFLR